MTARLARRAVLAFALLAAAPVLSQPASVVLDDFESGVGAWRSNDAQADGERPSEICAVYTISRGGPEAVEQAAIIEFEAAEGTWASVTLPVKGSVWGDYECGQLGLWFRGDGSESSVQVTLRALVGEERRDLSYSYPVKLDSREWERRSLRFFAFKDADGKALTHEVLSQVYLLQFVKRGTWPALSFCVDDIHAEPIPGETTQPTEPAEQLSTRVDFGRALSPMLAQVGVNLGSELGLILDSSVTAAHLARGLEELAPCVVRVRLADFYDARNADYDLIRLNRTLNWIADAGARPLICLCPPRLPGSAGVGLDEQFMATAVKLVSLRRGGPNPPYYELFDSPLLSGQFTTVEELVAAYNRLCASLLAADPEARVGGPGLASAWDSNVRGFLEGADTLHFLSLHFFGAHNILAEPAALFGAAVGGVTVDLPNQLTLQQVKHLAHTLRRPIPELFVTAMAMNSARGEKGVAADERLTEGLGAAWTAAAALSAAPYADKLLHFKLFGGGWGLMAASGQTHVTHRAAWLVRTYAPRGATLCQLLRPHPEVLMAAVWTPTARNLLTVHAGEQPRVVVVDCWGIGSPLFVRERHLHSDGQLGMRNLPNSSAQTIEFDGPGLSVIQFVSQQ